MNKFYSLCKKGIIYMLPSMLLFISPKLNAQSCLDFSVNVGEDPYMFIDFFKTAGAWKVSGSSIDSGSTNVTDRYKIKGEDQFKIVNGAYHYLNSKEFNGKCNSIHYWDMMVDQQKILPSGYPISLPLTIHPYKAKSVDPNQGIDISKSIVVHSISRDINIPAGAPFSGWILRWKGKGTFSLDGLSDITMNSGSKKIIAASIGGGSTYEFTSAEKSGGNATVSYNTYPHISARQLKINSSNIADPIRDIEFVYPGMESLLDAGRNINPKFIEKVSKYKVVRYMDYMHANGIQERMFVAKDHPYHISHYLKELAWTERTTSAWYKVNATHEYIAEISNLSGTSPWINIPYAAGKDYVENMVSFYLTKLDPNLKIYVEVGNELWNYSSGSYNSESCSWQPGYSGFFYFDAYGNYNYPGLGSNASAGKRVNELYKYLTAAAGSSQKRIVRIVGAQTGYSQLTQVVIDQMEDQNWDALAIAWYYGLSGDSTSYNSCKSPNGKNWRAELYNYWVNNPDDQAAFNIKYKEAVLSEFRCMPNYLRLNSKIAKTRNKKLISYEGSSAVVYGAQNGPFNNSLAGELEFSNPKYPEYFLSNDFVYRLIKADQSEESGEILNEIIDSLKSNGVSLVNYYGLSGHPTAFGIWSLFNQADMDKSIELLYEQYPMYKAFNRRAKAEQSCTLTEIELGTRSVSAKGLLEQNIPNPASDFTIIPYSVLKEELIKIELINGQGRTIKTLVNEMQKPGKFSVEVEISDLLPGMYYYKLSGTNSETKKMVIIK